jgi:chemotaxis protein methyltransferase CheR
MGRKAETAKVLLRRAGPSAVFLHAVQKAGGALFSYERLDIIVLAKEAVQPVNIRRPGVTSVRVAQRTDLEFMNKDGGWRLEDSKLEWPDLGYVCFLSELDGEVAGYTWAHGLPTATLMDDLVITVPDQFVYNFDGFTHPDFRGYGLQGLRHHAVLDQPQWRGKQGLLGYVAGTNFSSKKGQSKSGYVGVGAIRCAKFRDKRLAQFGKGLRDFGVTRVSAWHRGDLDVTGRPHETPGWPRRVKSALGRRYAAFKRRFLYDTLLYPYGAWRHNQVLNSGERSSVHTFTRFHRVPEQLDALTGPVLDFLGGGKLPERLRVLVLAGSTGAEAYTIASVLTAAHPSLWFHIESSDLHQELVDLATEGVYPRADVFADQRISEDFVTQTFDSAEGSSLSVRAELKSKISFSQADLLEASLVEKYDAADVVFVQNVFFHLPPALAEAAFGNVIRLLKPRSALFIDGISLDAKVSLTKEFGLEPLPYRYREIYESSRHHIALNWWQYYYGCEPFRRTARDRVRRYSSVFLKGGADDLSDQANSDWPHVR